MSVPEPGLTKSFSETAVAHPAAPSRSAVRSRRVGLRAWMLSAVLFLVPLVAYWPATFHEYGLRDDYSNLREAVQEPSAVLKFCASAARPIYGWLLQATYGQAVTVQNLQWMRLFSSLLLGAISLVMFRGLRSLGWSFNASLCFAILLALVPSSQVIAGWAIGWPYAVTALLSIGIFFTADGAFNMGLRAGIGRAVGQWAVALCLMVIAALIYQPSALFYVVPLAAALISQRRRSLRQNVRWIGTHLAFVGISMGIAYAAMSAMYSAGWFVKSGRIAFEHHWGDKLAWFLGEALPNGLSLFVLNDDNHRNRILYLACAGIAGMILVAGAAAEWRRHGRGRGLVWTAALLGLPTFALGISLVASERFATYRTILAMTAVLLCFLVASVRNLTAGWSAASRRLLATSVLVMAFFVAQHHVYALIAVPQGNEWQLIVAGAKQVRLSDGAHPRIFAIASAPADISTASIYHDEFGSLSSNSEWVPKEMFKRAMHDLHPDIPNLDSRYDFVGGYKLPPGYRPPAAEHYDVVIDLHRLRKFYADN